MATLAVSEVTRMPKKDKTVLLMGSSGQMGSLILKNLLDQKNIRVIATVRSHNGICLSGGAEVAHVDYQDRYDSLEEADVVISATSSPHYTLTAARVREALCSAKERLFLDISMPPDLDVEIGRMEHCRLVALDDIKKLAEDNNRRKQQAFADAEEILNEELEKLCKALAFHRFTQKDADWKERYGDCSGEKMLYLLRDRLDSSSFEKVLQALAAQGW